MPAGIMRIDLRLPGNRSLKGKRQITQRLKAMLRRRFNLSVAELDCQDLHQRCVMGVSAISSSRDVIENEMRKVLQLLDSQRDCQVIEREIEYIP